MSEDRNGETLLHKVLQSGDAVLAETILDRTLFSKNLEQDVSKEQHFNFVYTQSNEGYSAIVQFLKTREILSPSDVYIVQTFILNNLPSATKSLRTPQTTTLLHMLIEHGHLGLIKFLFIAFDSIPIDMLAKDHLGKTPLETAFEMGNMEILGFIFEETRQRATLPDIEKYKTIIKKFPIFTKLQQEIIANKFLVVHTHELRLSFDDANCAIYHMGNITNEYILANFYKTLANKLGAKNQRADFDIWMNYVNTELCSKHNLVVFVIDRLSPFKLLEKFLRYLPFNFRLVILSCGKVSFKHKHYVILQDDGTIESRYKTLHACCQDKLDVTSIEIVLNYAQLKKDAKLYMEAYAIAQQVYKNDKDKLLRFILSVIPKLPGQDKSFFSHQAKNLMSLNLNKFI